MSPPWMPLYIADYRADTAHLSAAEHGAYLQLIMHYWTTGSLPDDDRQLARIACMSPAEWRRARPTIAAFFHDGWKHGRIEREMRRSAEVSETYARRARQAAEKRWSKDASSNASSIPSSNASGVLGDAYLQPQPQSQEDPSLRSDPPRARRWPFDPFWERFPNKVGKQDALKAFQRVEKSGAVTLEALMEGLERYVGKTDDRPWCNPSTWLNQGRWSDQPATVMRRNDDGKRSVQDAAGDLVERIRGLGDPMQPRIGGATGQADARLLPPRGRE